MRIRSPHQPAWHLLVQLAHEVATPSNAFLSHSDAAKTNKTTTVWCKSSTVCQGAVLALKICGDRVRRHVSGRLDYCEVATAT